MRLHRLLDSRFSGLADQLASDPGRQSGVILAHKSALSYVAENRVLAAPASVHPFDGSAGQEDFQAGTFVAAEQLERILDNLELILAAELLAIRQARHLRAASLPAPLEAVADRLAAAVAPVEEDRSLSDDVERIRDLIRSGALSG
jgi:histidine ammonia-lyase